MIIAYIILAIVVIYIDFGFQTAELSATVPIILLVAVLYKISKLTNLIEEEKKEREKLRAKEVVQQKSTASSEEQKDKE